jgi:hypothetical protein
MIKENPIKIVRNFNNQTMNRIDTNTKKEYEIANSGFVFEDNDDKNFQQRKRKRKYLQKQIIENLSSQKTNKPKEERAMPLQGQMDDMPEAEMGLEDEQYERQKDLQGASAFNPTYADMNEVEESDTYFDGSHHYNNLTKDESVFTKSRPSMARMSSPHKRPYFLHKIWNCICSVFNLIISFFVKLIKKII